MANIQRHFTQIRTANGIENAQMDRRTIKNKLQKNFDNIQFASPQNPKEPERVYFKSVGDAAIESSSKKSDKGTMETVFECAHIQHNVISK